MGQDVRQGPAARAQARPHGRQREQKSSAGRRRGAPARARREGVLQGCKRQDRRRARAVHDRATRGGASKHPNPPLSIPRRGHHRRGRLAHLNVDGQPRENASTPTPVLTLPSPDSSSPGRHAGEARPIRQL